MGDTVEAVDRRIGAFYGRAGAARVRVSAGRRPMPVTTGPIGGQSARTGTTATRAGSVRARSAAASAANGAVCSPVARAAAQSNTAHLYASTARPQQTGHVRLHRGNPTAGADRPGQLAAAPAAAAVTRSRAQLTRRGQLALVALAAVIALVLAGLLISWTSGTATQRPEPVGQRSIVVQPGQTLWSIAKDVAPDRDVREVIFEIRRINKLDSAMVRSGQTLVLPTG